MNKIKYPKFILLILIFVIAYLIFDDKNNLPFDDVILSTNYLGVFFVGIFYAYGFTAPLAMSTFLMIGNSLNIYLIGLIGGLGALVGDLFIFSFIKISFSDEVEKLSHSKYFSFLKHRIPAGVKKVIYPLLAAVIIASPLPDELGVSFISATNLVSKKRFMLFSYFLNAIGIFLILYFSKLILK